MDLNELSYDRSVYVYFKQINDQSYHEKVKYVEENREEINQLRFKDRLHIQLEFLLSLFQVGDYERYLEFVDEQVEVVIEKNVFEFKNKDIYFLLLQNKALSFYHLLEFEKSISLARQLQKMNGDNQVIKYILKNALSRRPRTWFRTVHSIAILLALMTSVVLLFELFLVRPTYPSLVTPIELTRNITLLSSVGLIALNQIFLFIVVSKEVKG